MSELKTTIGEQFLRKNKQKKDIASPVKEKLLAAAEVAANEKTKLEQVTLDDVEVKSDDAVMLA